LAGVGLYEGKPVADKGIGRYIYTIEEEKNNDK
jgi:hypothetical protein